jgi:hypothetical protein
MSVAEDTTQIPTPIPEVVVIDNAAAVVTAVVNDLQSTISNTFEAPLKQLDETPKVVENVTNTILKESQAVIDETSKLLEEINNTMVGKSDSIMSEGKAIVDEATKLVESAVKTAENIANIISEEEKRLTDTISRLSIEMEQETKKATGLFVKIHKFIKLITSCTHGADKSVIIPVVVKTDHVDVKVANVV